MQKGDEAVRRNRYANPMLNRRLFLATLPMLLATRPALAERLSLDAISAYLGTLQSVSADFTQIGDDGTIETGKIYIRRPGRARFEYAPPNDALVIAGGGTVAIFDPGSNLPPKQYPLSRTPLGMILARRVDLGSTAMVADHRYEGTATTVVMQDPEHPEYGSINLIFTGPPVALHQWIITDAGGSATKVILGALMPAPNLPAKLFNIPQEMQARGL